MARTEYKCSRAQRFYLMTTAGFFILACAVELPSLRGVMPEG